MRMKNLKSTDCACGFKCILTIGAFLTLDTVASTSLVSDVPSLSVNETVIVGMSTISSVISDASEVNVKVAFQIEYHLIHL